MKYLIIILIICLYSCSGSKFIYEDTLYVTRKYCGNFDTAYIEGKYTKIITDIHQFYIAGKIPINIEKGTKCYLKYIPEYIHPFSQQWILYFTYDGTGDFYMLKQNFITGRIY